MIAGDWILVVDDNRMNLKLARVLLETAGYRVETASNAEHALTLLETFQPQVILIDVQLPGIDGFELARRLKADPAQRGIALIAVTAYATREDQNDAYAAGCDGYLTKPIDPAALSATIEKLLTAAAGGAGDTP